MGKLKRQRWELFAQGIVAGLSGAEAYRRAGYENKTPASDDAAASRLLRNVKVAERIEELREAILSKSQISRQWVLDRLKENVERAMQSKPVYDSEGKPTGEYVWNGSVANKGLELIGTELGMFVEKIEQDTLIRVISDRPMTPEEWAAEYGREGEEPLKITGPGSRSN